jgi:hypothetical protein
MQITCRPADLPRTAHDVHEALLLREAFWRFLQMVVKKIA